MNSDHRLARPARAQQAWLALRCVLALICIGMPAAAFAKSLEGTFVGQAPGSEVLFERQGKPLTDWAGTLNFRLDSGEDLLVYCIQIDVRVRSGDRYRSDGPVLALPNGCQIRYLLDAYPASTAKDADEAAARQMAIWVFSDGIDPDTITDAKVRARTVALVAEATGKPCPKRRTAAPDLTIVPAAASAAAGQLVDYTVQASPADAGRPITVALSGPAAFADAAGASTGQQQLTIALSEQSAATVRVLLTGAGPVNVAVALPYQLEAGTVYSQIDDKRPTQRLVMAESRDLVANASVQLTGTTQAPPLTQTPTPAPTSSPPDTTPSATARQPAQQTPTEQATVTVLAGEGMSSPPSAAAEAPSSVVPLVLPATGGPVSRVGWLLLAGAALLLGGWLLRRQLGPAADRTAERSEHRA